MKGRIYIGLFASIVLFVAAVVFVVVSFIVYKGNDLSQEEKPVFCTQDAKLCPDGSYVGRIAPDCEFSVCPATDGLFLE